MLARCFVIGRPPAYTDILLTLQGKLSEADPLYKTTHEVFEDSLGQDHANVATILNRAAGC